MGIVTRFKTLRALKDPVSASQWNRLADAVWRLCGSGGPGGLWDATGLHLRVRPQRRWSGYWKIVSNEGQGLYTLRPQVWSESAGALADLEEAGERKACEVGGDDRGEAGEIVRVLVEASLEGEWIGLFDRGRHGLLNGTLHDDTDEQSPAGDALIVGKTIDAVEKWSKLNPPEDDYKVLSWNASDGLGWDYVRFADIEP